MRETLVKRKVEYKLYCIILAIIDWQTLNKDPAEDKAVLN